MALTPRPTVALTSVDLELIYEVYRSIIAIDFFGEKIFLTCGRKSSNKNSYQLKFHINNPKGGAR